MTDADQILDAGCGLTTNPRVIYVMGAGRSGSTILGVALGNADTVFYAGELDAWLRRSGVPNFGGSDRESFWDLIRNDVKAAVELHGDLAWRCLEHSLAPFRVACWSTSRRIRPEYLRIAEELYRSVARRSKATHIVDTSHYPLRARMLQRRSGVNLYLVYLVRNPHSVVTSFERKEVNQPPKSRVATNAYLFLTTILSIWVFLRHPRDQRLFVRYEQFIADPERVVGHILAGAGLSARSRELAVLETGLPFQGNRVLNRDTITLERGTTRRTRGSLLTTMLQLPCTLALFLLRPVVASSALDHDPSTE
jgi:hypothetical protein